VGGVCAGWLLGLTRPDPNRAENGSIPGRAGPHPSTPLSIPAAELSRNINGVAASSRANSPPSGPALWPKGHLDLGPRTINPHYMLCLMLWHLSH